MLLTLHFNWYIIFSTNKKSHNYLRNILSTTVCVSSNRTQYYHLILWILWKVYCDKLLTFKASCFSLTYLYTFNCIRFLFPLLFHRLTAVTYLHNYQQYINKITIFKNHTVGQYGYTNNGNNISLYIYLWGGSESQ